MLALAVHGGAWNIPDEAVDDHRRGVARALQAGWEALSGGAPALDVVELVVRVLEDDPTFDAGRGARLNRDGGVELDASIMEGATLRAGAVAAVRRVRHPVTLARAVMERSEHVMLAGAGAGRFADECGIPRCSTRSLLVGHELERYERVRRGDRRPITEEFARAPHGTVGAVARDARGRLAAATSTGGTQDKRPGRIGDSPVPGAGTYADDRCGAASCTGHGEAILRVVLAKEAVDRLRGSGDAGRAASAALRALGRVGGKGGLILLGRRGAPVSRFNTPRMARGAAWGEGGLRVGVGSRLTRA